MNIAHLFRLAIEARRATYFIAIAFSMHFAAITPAHSASRMVFADYMISFPTYGTSISDYAREMDEAKTFGIDGFAVSITEWSTATLEYRTRVWNFFIAASQAADFKVFFNFDMCCSLTEDDIKELMSTYGGRFNYLRLGNRPVMTTFTGQALGPSFWSRILAYLGRKDMTVAFVPYFFIPTTCTFTDTTCADYNEPSQSDIANLISNWTKNIAGLHYFAVGATEDGLSRTSEHYASALASAGKVYLAGVSPYFWIGRIAGIPRRFYETHGGEGIAAQWRSIIMEQKPDWVLVETWNDYTESYLSPADPELMPQKAAWWNVGPLLRPHIGYAKLFSFYINWFKSNSMPSPDGDRIFYFYRTHRKDASATSDPSPVYQYGQVEDDIYITAILSGPAVLTTDSGGVSTTLSLPAGITHVRVPFQTGHQSFQLLRGGAIIYQGTGLDIDASISKYNFVSYSGYLGP